MGDYPDETAELHKKRVVFIKWLYNADKAELKKRLGNLERSGDLEGFLRAGLIYKRLGKKNDALEIISHVADRRYPLGLYEYAILHFDGECMEQNLERGFQYLQFAMSEGSAEAAAKIGDLLIQGQFSNGKYSPDELKCAMECYQNAAALGDGYGALCLAKLFRHYGTAVEKRQVPELLQLSVDQDYSEGQYLLAIVKRDGEWCERDLDAAQQLFSQAIANGSIEAKRELGRMLAGEAREKSSSASWLRNDTEGRKIKAPLGMHIFPYDDRPDGVMYAIDGRRLVETDYFGSELESRGMMMACGGAKVLHLLLPSMMKSGDDCENVLLEMRTGKYAIASVCDEEFSKEYLELMFEDDSPTPYMVALSRRVVMPLFSRLDDGASDLTLKVYAEDALWPKLEMPLRLRFVPRLPWGSQWN